MKKIHTHLTGIVFAIAILLAVACDSAIENVPQGSTYKKVATDPSNQPVPEEADTVIIYLLKAFEDNKGKHLKMCDSNEPDSIVVDALETYVWPKTVVIWVALDTSEIRRLKKISPKDGNGEIMPGDAAGFFYTLFAKKKKHKVPELAPRPSDKEKYLIKFRHDDGKIWEIDPYLKIPNP